MLCKLKYHRLYEPFGCCIIRKEVCAVLIRHVNLALRGGETTYSLLWSLFIKAPKCTRRTPIRDTWQNRLKMHVINVPVQMSNSAGLLLTKYFSGFSSSPTPSCKCARLSRSHRVTNEGSCSVSNHPQTRWEILCVFNQNRSFLYADYA